MSESLDLLWQSVAVEPLDLLDDLRMDGAAAVGEETAVRHLLRQRMLERVFRVWKEARLVEKLRGLQMRKLAAQVILGPVGDGVEQGEGNLLSDDRGRLQQLLLGRRESVNPGGQDGLDRGRDLKRVEGRSEAMGPTLTNQGLCLHEGPHALFKKERVSLRPLDEELS
jgi:hypothetical protein